MEPIAHVRRNKNGEWETHELKTHLQGVSRKAVKFAQKFYCEDWIAAASLLHDLGKGSSVFQRKIKSKSGFDPEAHIKDGEGNAPHSTHGAVWALQNWGEQAGKILAYLIAGHHGGLPDWYHEIGIGGSLEYRLKPDEIAKLPPLKDDFVAEMTKELSLPSSVPGFFPERCEHFHMWVRMLYSCLVDADYLDTERFMNPDISAIRCNQAPIETLKQLFEAHMASLSRQAPPTVVNKLRKKILSQCRMRAKEEQGLFSLTVPTGGGKTLSSMAFALEHAEKYKKDRIIFVIPFTSIIEQTSKIYKEIFGETNVIEHHCSLDPDRQTLQSQLATENWDAPIIVTTSVQFFESLFAAKSSSSRKLHNIVNSVVIIDEVQMLPMDYLKPILHCINSLTQYFNVSMVLCTATQPAVTSEVFQKENGNYYSIIKEEQCREIMVSPTPEELTKEFQRVEVMQVGKFSDWESLALALVVHEKVLCIVNTRNDCRELYKKVAAQRSGSTIHLSANMCGKHRSECIENIKDLLKKKQPVCVISTQLVEAGVDLDFPVVYRAMAGFDSIAQAAGRCNREGVLAKDGIPAKGKVFVFKPPKPAPLGQLRKGEQAGSAILEVDPEGCKKLLPQTFKKYFELFFASLNTFDRQHVEDLLVKDAPELNFQFRSAAHKFNLIDNQRQVSVVIWRENDKEDLQELTTTLRYTGPYRELMRKLQRYTISIPEHVFLEVRSYFEEINGVWCQYAYTTVYDKDLGFDGYGGEVAII